MRSGEMDRHAKCLLRRGGEIGDVHLDARMCNFIGMEKHDMAEWVPVPALLGLDRRLR
jgi:hypothetical protein